jgi:hypothetical protein
MTLTGINLIHTTGSFTSSIISINFNPPSFPYNVNAGDFVDIEIQICAGSGNVEDVLNIQPVSAEHGSESHLFSFGYPALPPTITPSSIDFGVVPFGDTSANFQICISNNSTLCSNNFDIDNTACAGIVPRTLRLAPDPGGADTDCANLSWTPEEPCQILDCDIVIDLCGTEFLIPVTGQATDAGGEPCGEPCPCLCCTGVDINAEGKCLGTWSTACDNEAVFNQSAIGEQKQVSFRFTYAHGIGDNFELFFNPIIWAVTCNYSTKYGGPINAAPPSGYYIELFSSMIGSGWFPMSLYGATTNTPNQKNWIVEIQVVTSTSFEVRLTMFMISDLEDWISAAVFNNAPKWRRNHVLAPVPALTGPLVNTFPSVYNSQRKLCSLFWVHDPNKLNPNGSEFTCYNTHSINWTSRFFNKGLNNGPSEFTDPLFIFERNGNPVSTLSTIQKTEVKFYINIPNVYGDIQCVFFNLFDESTTDNSVDFLQNYNNSRSQIVNNAVISVLDNLLESPSSVTALGGDDYEVTAFIGTGLNVSHQYRIFAVVYSKNDMVNSFISDPLKVTNVPEPDCENCQIETTSGWNQIFLGNISNCIRPVAKERIQHVVTFGEGTLKDCFGRSINWLDYIVSLSLNVYFRQPDFPVSGKTTFFMFNQETSNRIVGYPGNWNNPGNLIVQDSGSDIVSEFTRRVGFESSPFSGSNVFTANTSTFINRTPAGVLGSPYVTTLGVTNDWRGSEIIYEYILRMDFSSIYGTPFEINYVKGFRVLAIENEPTNSGFDQKIFGFQFECLSGGVWSTIDGVFCPDNCDQIRATYTANESGNFAFFANITPGGNTSNVKESEDTAFNLPQQLNVISLDLTYSPSGLTYEATALIDPSTLTPGLSYELCGYWSKSNP